MRIRLDPPELGTMQVQIEMRDGMLAASFQTSTDDATRLLTHSLHQLKQALEFQGVNVDKLQVEQAPREKFAQSSHDQQQQQQREEGRSPQQQQHEQQRREILQRLWRRIRGGREPFDELA
jgi:flagellar hook-length control protein FliK